MDFQIIVKIAGVPPLDPRAADEECRICQRRRGEHLGNLGTYCPGQIAGEESCAFIGSGRMAETPQDVRERRAIVGAIGRKRPRFRRLLRVDRETGAQVVDGWELANEAELSEEQRRCAEWDGVLP